MGERIDAARQAADAAPVDAACLGETLQAMGRVAERKYDIPAASVTPDRELATLGLDSLAFVEYAFEVEGELGITLPDIPHDLKTVGDLARFVCAEVVRKNARPAAPG